MKRLTKRQSRLMAALFYSMRSGLSGRQLQLMTGLWSGTLYVALYSLEEAEFIQSRRMQSGARLYSLIDRGRRRALAEFRASALTEDQELVV